MRLFLTLILAIFIHFPSEANATQHSSEQSKNKEYSLYVSECVSGNVCSIIDIIKYKFINGVPQPRKVLGHFSTDKIRFDLGASTIVGNRYLVPGLGEKAIDTIDGNIVLQSSLSETLQKEIRDSKPALEHKNFELHSYSPDRTKEAYAEDDEIYTRGFLGLKSVLASELSVQLSQFCCEILVGVPFLWLDNNRILTQQRNGRIILVTDNDQSSEPELIADIPNLKPALSSPSFEVAPDGTVYYYISMEKIGSKYFKIDVEGKSYKPLEYLPIGNNFSIEVETEKRAQNIRYLGKNIGTYWCSTWDAKTTDGHLAVLYGSEGSNLGYPEGVAVWNRHNAKWFKIKHNWGHRILGWIKD